MKPPAVLAMGSAELAQRLFPPTLRARLEELVDLSPTVLTDLDSYDLEPLLRAQLLIGGWESPRIHPALAPELRAVVHLGGSATACLDDAEQWAERNLQLANCRIVNARPVAEYTLAMILLAGKDAFGAAERYGLNGRIPHPASVPSSVGNFRRTVGLVGLAQVARLLIELLRPFDIDVLVYDPWLNDAEASALGVQRVELDELMSRSDIVSLHQALTPQTTGQIDANLLASMRDGATLLNTARGGVIDQEALTREVSTGRLNAILDVTTTEPLPLDDPLRQVPGVLLTPHIAGSMGTELERLGESALEEVRRFVAGEPFLYSEAFA